MTLSRLHVFARRRRRRVALLAMMLCLGGAVVVAHGALGQEHMGKGTVMCVAVLSVGAAAFAGGFMRAAVERLWAPVLALAVPAPATVLFSPRKLPQTRAGPAVLQVFLR